MSNRFKNANAINQQLRPGQEFQNLDITKVYPNPENPRKNFDPIKLQELSNSIVEHGLMQPIVVKLTEDGNYIIYAGERRFKAHILESDNIQELALIENIQREDLTDYETAISIKALLDTYKYPKKQDLANAIGKTSQYISKALKVLSLDDEVQEEISSSNDKVSTSVMIEISKQPKENQKAILKEYNQGNIKRDDINKPVDVLPTSKNTNIFILFQTDIYKTKKNRVCFGVFSTEVLAIDHAKENDLYTSEAEVEIIETSLDEFMEV